MGQKSKSLRGNFRGEFPPPSPAFGAFAPPPHPNFRPSALWTPPPLLPPMHRKTFPSRHSPSLAWGRGLSQGAGGWRGSRPDQQLRGLLPDLLAYQGLARVPSGHFWPQTQEISRTSPELSGHHSLSSVHVLFPQVFCVLRNEKAKIHTIALMFTTRCLRSQRMV